MIKYDRTIKNELIDILVILFENKGFDVKLIEYVDLIDDLGMDSLTFISMVVEIEAHFDMTIHDDMLSIDNFKTIDSIVRIIEDEKLKFKGTEVIADV